MALWSLKKPSSFPSLSSTRLKLFNKLVSRTGATGVDLLKLGNDDGQDELSHSDVLYGIHPITCALDAKRRSIQTVFFRRDLVEHSERVKKVLERCWAENIKTQAVHRREIDGLLRGNRHPHQGLLARVSRLFFHPTPCTEDFVARSLGGLRDDAGERQPRPKVWLLLHAIQDPMNFGSILRSAYFLGCDKVFVTSQNSCSLTPVVSKASSGAMELMPVHSVNNLPEFCRILRQLNWEVVGTKAPSSSGGGVVPHLAVGSFQLEKSTLIIFGNEGQGMEEHSDLCARHIYIPSRPHLSSSVDSLNVSAAAAVVLHGLLSRNNA